MVSEAPGVPIAEVDGVAQLIACFGVSISIGISDRLGLSAIMGATNFVLASIPGNVRTITDGRSFESQSGSLTMFVFVVAFTATGTKVWIVAIGDVRFVALRGLRQTNFGFLQEAICKPIAEIDATTTEVDGDDGIHPR